MTVSEQLIPKNRYTRPGIRLKQVKAVAIHYAGDPGATAKNLRDYFAGTCVRAKRYASCHYAVGLAGEVIRLIPETEISYCTNQANTYTVSVEVCHPDATGKFTAAGERSLVDLSASLCRKYGLNPLSGGLIRHCDVTGKQCPLYYVAHPGLWTQFRQAVADCMAGRPYTLPSYGTAAGTAPAACDTTADFSIEKGRAYQFKVTSAVRPALTAGSPSFRLVSQNRSGNDYYFKFQAVGSVGDVCGFYLNDPGKPLLRVTIVKSSP